MVFSGLRDKQQVKQNLQLGIFDFEISTDKRVEKVIIALYFRRLLIIVERGKYV